VLLYESYSTLEGVVMVECGTVMENEPKGKPKPSSVPLSTINLT